MKEQEEILKKYEDDIFKRIFSYSSDRCGLFIVGIIFALANGTIFPIFSLFLARMLNVLLDLYINPNNQEAIDQANLFALLFFVLGIANFICMTMQIALFRIIGESITIKLRV